MELEFNNSLPEFLDSPINSKDIEFSSNREFTYSKVKVEETKDSVKGKFSNIQKMMKLATSVSLTATSMGVGAAVIVPIIKPVEKPKPIIIEVEEEIEEEYISEYATLINGDWYLIGKKVTQVINGEETVLTDESFFSDDSTYSIKMDESDLDYPVMYLSYLLNGEEISEPLIKIEDNLFSTTIEKEDGVYKIYASLIDGNLLIKEVGGIHSSLSEEGRIEKYTINYYYYGKDNNSIYIPNEIITDEVTDEEEVIEEEKEPTIEELENGREDIDENGEKFNPNEKLEDEMPDEIIEDNLDETQKDIIDETQEDIPNVNINPSISENTQE